MTTVVVDSTPTYIVVDDGPVIQVGGATTIEVDGTLTVVPPTALDDLTDVDAAAPSDGDALVWDEGAGSWVPGEVEGGGGEVVQFVADGGTIADDTTMALCLGTTATLPAASTKPVADGKRLIVSAAAEVDVALTLVGTDISPVTNDQTPIVVAVNAPAVLVSFPLGGDWGWGVSTDYFGYDATQAGKVLTYQSDGTIRPETPTTGGADLSDDNPEALGTVEPGTSDEASRADHVHPMPSASDVGAAADDHNHDGTYAAVGHNHSGVYDPAGTAAGLVDDLSGVSNAAAARTNLGLGTAAVEAASAFAPATLWSRLASAVTIQSTDTLADSGLSVSVAASTTYRLRAVLLVGGNNIADAKFAVVLPTGATFVGTAIFPSTGAGGAQFTAAQIGGPSVNSITEDTAWAVGAPGNDSRHWPCIVDGIVEVSATAGTCKVQWAQAVSTAANTLLQKHSYLQLDEVT